MLGSELIIVAEALDREDCWTALKELQRLTPQTPTPAIRNLVISLWRRALQLGHRRRVLTSHAAMSALRFIEACDKARATGDVWAVHRLFPAVEEALGAPSSAALTLAALWDTLPNSEPAFRYDVLVRVSIAGNVPNLLALWEHMLRDNTDIVPDYLLYQALAKGVAQNGETDVAKALEELLKSTGRDDLAPLFEIYFLLLKQINVLKAMRLTRDLSDPVHREKLATYLLGASQTDQNLPHAVALYGDLVGEGGSIAGVGRRALRRARILSPACVESRF